MPEALLVVFGAAAFCWGGYCAANDRSIVAAFLGGGALGLVWVLASLAIGAT
jgi:hypothetical protein